MNRLLKQSTAMTWVWRAPAFMLLLLASAGSMPPEPSGTGTGELQCTWTEGARTVMTFPDGTEAFVEPSMMVPVDGGVALVGIPNYQFPPGEYRLVADSLFGALIRWDLSAQPVLPPPVEGELYAHSAFQMEDGALLVGFAVIRPGKRSRQSAIAARLGVGRYSAGTWGPVTWVMPPDGLRVEAFWPSKLVAVGDSIFWAFRANTMRPDAALVMVQGTLDHLSLQAVPIPAIEQVSLAYLPETGPAVAFTRAVEDGDTLLFTLTVAPLDRGVLQTSGPTVFEPVQIHRPEFLEPLDPGWVSAPMGPSPHYPGPRVAIAVEVLPSGTLGEPIVIGEHVAGAVPVGNMEGDRPIWALSVVEGDPQIVLTTLVDGAPRTEYRLPDPFYGSFGATLLSPTSVLLAGPILGGTAEVEPTLKNLLIRLDARCGPA